MPLQGRSWSCCQKRSMLERRISKRMRECERLGVRISPEHAARELIQMKKRGKRKSKEYDNE